MGLRRPPRNTPHISVLVLLSIGDLGSVIWEVLAAIVWEAWLSVSNLVRLTVATYPLMSLLSLVTTSNVAAAVAARWLGAAAGAYLYASFLRYFGLRDRLPWACLAAALLTFESPAISPRLLRRAAVVVFMMARDENLGAVVSKRVRSAWVPWEEGSGFEFLFNFEGRELLREVCLYLVNALCSSFDRPRVVDDFKLRTSVRIVDVVVLPLVGLFDWIWRYRRAQRRAMLETAMVEGRGGKE